MIIAFSGGALPSVTTKNAVGTEKPPPYMRPYSCRSPHNAQLRVTHSLAHRAYSFLSFPSSAWERATIGSAG